MINMTYDVERIGIIRSPFKELVGMPIQPKGSKDVKGVVEINPEYVNGLKDLDAFSHIYLVYVFHKAPRTELTVIPYLDKQPKGVFATRSPLRPSHIGMSIVELITIDGNNVHVRGVDVLDGTPLLDIKPFIPKFDNHLTATMGWMTASGTDIETTRSDDRFA